MHTLTQSWPFDLCVGVCEADWGVRQFGRPASEKNLSDTQQTDGPQQLLSAHDGGRRHIQTGEIGEIFTLLGHSLHKVPVQGRGKKRENQPQQRQIYYRSLVIQVVLLERVKVWRSCVCLWYFPAGFLFFLFFFFTSKERFTLKTLQ